MLETHRRLAIDTIPGFVWTALPNGNVDFINRLPIELQARVRAADGHYRWFLVRAMPLRDGVGQVIKWYGQKLCVEGQEN